MCIIKSQLGSLCVCNAGNIFLLTTGRPKIVTMNAVLCTKAGFFGWPEVSLSTKILRSPFAKLDTLTSFLPNASWTFEFVSSSAAQL